MDRFNHKNFAIVTLVVFLWVNVGEIARAMFVAFPRIMKFYEGTGLVIGQMDVSHALVWVLWDLLLTSVLVIIFWLCSKAFGNNSTSVFISSVITVLATLGVFWIATINTGLGEWSSFYIIMPLAWIELYIGAWFASLLYRKLEK